MNEGNPHDQVRDLCRQIAEEQDPDRVEELITTLRNTIRISQEETRLRMSFLARHFRGRLHDMPIAGGEPVSQGAGRVRAVLDFLGLGAGMRLGREIEG